MKTKVFLVYMSANVILSSITRIFLVISWSCYWCAKCNFMRLFFFIHCKLKSMIPVSSFIFDLVFSFSRNISLSRRSERFFALWNIKWYKLISLKIRKLSLIAAVEMQAKTYEHVIAKRRNLRTEKFELNSERLNWKSSNNFSSSMHNTTPWRNMYAHFFHKLFAMTPLFFNYRDNNFK